MRVLLINLPSPPRKNIERDFAGGYGVLGSRSRRRSHGHDIGKSVVLPPLTEAYASAVLRKAEQAPSILDGQAEDLSLDDLIRRVRVAKPELIVTRPSLHSFEEDLQILSRLREDSPETRIVLWGPPSMIYAHEVLAKGTADWVIQGDPIGVLPVLCSALEEGSSLEDLPGVSLSSQGVIKGSPAPGPVRDLDSLPSPAYDLVRMELYRDCGKIEMSGSGPGRRFFTVQSSTGCPYGCHYCPYVVDQGTIWRALSPRRTVDEIERLVGEHGVEAIWFRDPTWNVKIERSKEICRELIGRGIRVPWRAEMRADLIDRELAQLMSEAGCVNAQLGLETGNQSILARIGKRGADLRSLREGFRALGEASVPITANVLVGLPGESWATVVETAKLIDELEPSRINVAFLVPYPGTRIFDELKGKGWLLDDDRGAIAGDKPVVSYEGFTDREIALARRYLLDRGRGKEKYKRFLRSLRDMHLDVAADELGWIAREGPVSGHVDRVDRSIEGTEQQ